MKVIPHFGNDYKKKAKGIWSELLKIYIQLNYYDRRKVNGQKFERIKQEQLPPYVFLDCVWTLYEALGNEWGLLDLDAYVNSLDYLEGGRNIFCKYNDDGTYNYVCPRFYIRSIIFGGVWCVMMIEHPELEDIANKMARKVAYDESQKVYFGPFWNLVKVARENPKRLQKSTITKVESEIHHSCYDYVMQIDDMFRKRWYKPFERYRRLEVLSSEIEDVLAAIGSANNGVIIQTAIKQCMENLRKQYEVGSNGPWDTSGMDDSVFDQGEKDALIEELKQIVEDQHNKIEELTKLSKSEIIGKSIKATYDKYELKKKEFSIFYLVIKAKIDEQTSMDDVLNYINKSGIPESKRPSLSSLKALTTKNDYPNWNIQVASIPEKERYDEIAEFFLTEYNKLTK